ncbi:hypothetical protein CCX46_23905 [Pseudomonas sp. RU47]|uniref:dermonecrotic toxin domain-containing protein n=1 Tax=Pseudomonas sp. RU47 TaxID=2005388 RepID=UPI000FDE089A|nr:DUF6543 domain-containing protein [Pseudomonas sp. RU47]AZZ78056.1 hypothetical protein CCX46_23905 [Pseudomonas sp. RU47]
MPDQTTRALPSAPSPTLKTSTRLAKTTDDSLALRASRRWQNSSDGLRELYAASPGLRDSLNELLQEKLQLDGEKTVLRFAAIADHPERRVSLTEACAFVLQQPTLDVTLDQRSQVSGLAAGHPLFALKPLQVLEKLKALDPQQFHATRWANFWEARAPHAAVSRRERSLQFYREHLEATADMALARRTITAQQLKPLQQILDSPCGALLLDGQPIHTQQLALLLSNGSKVKLAGAWVISVDDPASASPLLYLPSRSVPVQFFKTRNEMENWLSRQGLVPTGLPGEHLRFEYTTLFDPLVSGSSDLFASRQQAQISALCNTNKGRPGLWEHGAQSLMQVDLLDRQRSTASIVASAPSASHQLPTFETGQKPLFGSLSAGIALGVRQAAIKREREALDTLLENDRNGAHKKACQDALNAIEAAEQACDKAVDTLLYQAQVSELSNTHKDFTALHQAHKDALYAEAKLQLALGQLDTDQHALLKAVLDNTGANETNADVSVASLTLSMTETVGGTTSVQTEKLKGPFVIMRSGALSDRDSPDSLLLYWPGSGGGLQAFANRRRLEREALMIQDNTPELTLQLNEIATAPLHACLDELLDDYKAKAAPISDKAEQADALEILRKNSRAAFQVPVHAARSLAFAHVLEQDRSATLAEHLPDWLINLNSGERSALKKNLEAYIAAMRKSHQLMTLALEPRDDFTRKHLHARLRKDFSLEGDFSVQVELPDSTRTEPHYESGPGGHRKTTVIVPGATRSKMPLEDLAQLNIDNVQSVLNDSLSQRLIFLRAEVSATHKTDRIRLLNGINLTYLRRALPELDLPKAYEQKIRDAFIGAATEPVFVKEHRRESLIEPWRLMLTIQAESARLRKHISNDEAATLNTAIAACTPQAWLADGKRIALLPVSLKVGGKDTPREGPVTLSGVTFIEEQISGVTLLYLPESPDEQFLRRYDNLEAARKGLFRLCASDKWVTWLAGRTLQGDVKAHVGRIHQAVEKNFDALIEVGERWPQSTSLAAHLLDAHMGRLIEAHRGSSRSNDELFFERHALKGPRAFNYILMAIGMVPFVGTALALYQAWTAANQATAAFLRGEVGDGLAEIESMLLSLIDALFDVLPGEAIASTLSRTSRTLTRTRQLHQLVGNVATLHGKTQRQARHVLARFADYEYEKPLSLSSVQPATHGIYRNIYRHADGDFIERQGRLYQVELNTDSRSWRLSGNSRKTYKQPIALDESGHWDTWFGVYGTTLEGGALGGGNVAGHLADRLDPYWPPVIRQRLPRWWADRAFRRQLQLTDEVEHLADLCDARIPTSKKAIDAYEEASLAERPALRAASEAACLEDIRLESRRYAVLEELKPLTHGKKLKSVGDTQSEVAMKLTERYWQRASHVSDSIIPVTDGINVQSRVLNALPSHALPKRLKMLEEVRLLRVEYLKKLDQQQELKTLANQWYARVKLKADKAHLVEFVEEMNALYSDANLLYVRATQRFEIVKNHARHREVSWFYLLQRAAELRAHVYRALETQYDLPKIITTPAQRSQILQNCADLYTRFRLQMKIWTASYPQHFHMDVVEPLLNDLEQMTSRALAEVKTPSKAKSPGEAVQRVFTTTDDNLIYGVEKWDSVTQRRRYERTRREGSVEIWEEGPDGKARLITPGNAETPATTPTALADLVTDAQQRLDAQVTYRATVESNADRGMLPVDLQHMMDSQAAELNTRADRIATVSAEHPIIGQLRSKADELIVTGRSVRTQRTFTSAKPTDGMLDDLIAENAVEIRRTRPIKQLSKRRGEEDYMQEYEVWNITAEPPRLLWYAHFHYRSAAPAFRPFEKAHLKLPAHRYLTHADDANLPYSDIGPNSIVLVHFEGI